jgi:hypothetical protein
VVFAAALVCIVYTPGDTCVATSRALAPMYVSASSGMVHDCGNGRFVFVRSSPTSLYY